MNEDKKEKGEIKGKSNKKIGCTGKSDRRVAAFVVKAWRVNTAALAMQNFSLERLFAVRKEKKSVS